MARIKDQSAREVVSSRRHRRGRRLRTSLRKTGARFIGRCPFHEERTPSFSVNAVRPLPLLRLRQGRRRVSFVRETEPRLRRGDRVARRPLPRPARVRGDLAAGGRRGSGASVSCGARASDRVLRAPALGGPDGEPVRAYLASRGLGEPIAQEFRLGLSPGRGLAAKARRRASPPTSCGRRAGERARQRLLPAAADVPAGGRARPRDRLPGAEAARRRPAQGKYVNSPESELFKKSNVLYGLHLARPAIAKQDRAVVVEGNTDVIALRQAGFEPVVASMGTALTEHQLASSSG